MRDVAVQTDLISQIRLEHLVLKHRNGGRGKKASTEAKANVDRAVHAFQHG